MNIKPVFVISAAVVLTGSGATAAPLAPLAQAPSLTEVAAAYPARAKAAGVAGEVVLSCGLRFDLSLEACEAISETPVGYGFAASARTVARQMKAAPGQGVVKGADVWVKVNFSPDMLQATPPTITQPRWAALPSAEDFQATFPKTENGVNSVRVVLACTALAGGALSDCAVDAEEPTGQGYGQGALALAAKFKVEPWSVDGKPTVGSRVRVPIRYQLTPVAAASR